MNSKRAKELRKSSNYHPKQGCTYSEWRNGVVVIKADTTKAQYRRLKNLFKKGE